MINPIALSRFLPRCRAYSCKFVITDNVLPFCCTENRSISTFHVAEPHADDEWKRNEVIVGVWAEVCSVCAAALIDSLLYRPLVSHQHFPVVFDWPSAGLVFRRDSFTCSQLVPMPLIRALKGVSVVTALPQRRAVKACSLIFRIVTVRLQRPAHQYDAFELIHELWQAVLTFNL